MILLLSACTADLPAPTLEEVVCPFDPPLHATLLRPAGATGALPTAVIVPGAQPWDRWGDLPDKRWGHYRELATAIVAAGGAALVYDKVGIGATGGRQKGLDGRKAEVVALASCLRARPDVGPLVLVGHSQGAAAVGETTSAIGPAAVVLLSPVGPPPEGVPVTVIQSDAEAHDEWHPVVIPGASHLLMAEPAVPGVSHVDARALDVAARAVVTR